MMRKILSSAIIAIILGVVMMLIPLTLPYADIRASGEIRPKASKNATLVERSDSAETTYGALAAETNWFNIALTISLGAISAAAASLTIKRKLRV
ncbi:hypothetical protein KEJ29_04075 [Candidatus Bathyarchaeota archaeon]|nr:hypothetical protein [Candidatus Bathyarchaeota archaeon]